MGNEKTRKPGELESLTTSWLGRGLKLSTTTAAVAARVVGAGLQKVVTNNKGASQITQRTQEAIARQMADQLGELKGLMMKMGQMVSYMDFALPEVARAAFEKLQHSTPPMGANVIAQIIFEEFGRGPRELFAEWSPNPIAAASIGQVHRARLHSGEEVAVKVQYPGISKTLDSDLKNAGLLDTLSTFLFRGQERGTFVAELRERLMEECDYLKEAANQEHFRELYSQDARVVIPRVFREFSTRRVLTTEFIQAKSFKEFNETASQSQRNRAGEVMWDVAFASIFRHCIFNGDPHPGNYLFTEDRVVFLDFGCVKRFDAAFVDEWRRLVRSVLERDRAGTDRIIVELGMAPKPESFDFDYNHTMILELYEPWLYDENFTFSQDYVARTWKKMMVDNKNKFSIRMPKDWVFTNRLQWGLYAVLAAMKADSNWRSRILALVYQPGEVRPAAFIERVAVAR
ncbi:MAG: AarF/ABC1/UbiB kinase family protein [Deltaproteobacteria bacterium]|nr:AarF/ABC1/UbiB kinase family protein [Deltaproteobacteria bacterium]